MGTTRPESLRSWEAHDDAVARRNKYQRRILKANLREVHRCELMSTDSDYGLDTELCYVDGELEKSDERNEAYPICKSV